MARNSAYQRKTVDSTAFPSFGDLPLGAPWRIILQDD
jgi:hypothetical protein